MTDPLYKMVNGVRVEMAPGEIAALRPVPALADARAAKLAELANLRWRRETGGLTLNGVTVATDEKSQSKLHAARTRAKENANYTVNWKTVGGFATLDATQIIAIADAVGDHVRECFDNEATHAILIGTYDDVQGVIEHDLSTGWP